MANFTSVRATRSTPQYPASEIRDEAKPEKHGLVCIFSRGIGNLAINYLKNLARQSGLPHRLLGDLTYIKDPEKSLSTASLIPVSGNEQDDIVHRVYLFHGRVVNEKHAVNVRNGESTEVITSSLLRKMHWPVSNAFCQAEAGKRYKNIDYHLSCNSAKLRNEFSADEAFWKSNVSLIFSSKKETAFDQMGAALDSALRYASYCNTPGNQSTLDQFKLFLQAGMRRGDCITMLGGELKAPLIWHAPKNQDDLLVENMLRTVRGNPLDCERLKQAVLALTVTQLSLLPPASHQLRDMFFTRIGRDDVESVRQILKHDINLLNEKSTLGMTALSWAIALNAHQCMHCLLSAGADLNAIDADGGTALLNALNQDDPDLFRNLLDKGANPNARNFEGNSPLMIAASKGWLEHVQILLAFNARTDVWNANKTALTIAVNLGDYEIVDALLMAGADMGCGLDSELIDQAEDQDDLAIVDLLERCLQKNSGNNDWVDMETDESEPENQ